MYANTNDSAPEPEIEKVTLETVFPYGERLYQVYYAIKIPVVNKLIIPDYFIASDVL